MLAGWLRVLHIEAHCCHDSHRATCRALHAGLPRKLSSSCAPPSSSCSCACHGPSSPASTGALKAAEPSAPTGCSAPRAASPGCAQAVPRGRAAQPPALSASLPQLRVRAASGCHASSRHAALMRPQRQRQRPTVQHFQCATPKTNNRHPSPCSHICSHTTKEALGKRAAAGAPCPRSRGTCCPSSRSSPCTRTPGAAGTAGWRARTHSARCRMHPAGLNMRPSIRARRLTHGCKLLYQATCSAKQRLASSELIVQQQNATPLQRTLPR